MTAARGSLQHGLEIQDGLFGALAVTSPLQDSAGAMETISGSPLPSKQNKSHAVMAQRSEPNNSLDFFPTPLWATRALLEHVIADEGPFGRLSCREPACGAGHMTRALGEYFGEVQSSDIFDYGYGEVKDYLAGIYEPNSCDWVITNPPFRCAEDFGLRSLDVARLGVAMLTRTVFIESVGRLNRLFSPYPPFKVAQFSERVPMVKGRVDRKASTATGYAWLIWKKNHIGPTELVWIPRCRKSLERNFDYAE